jgi:predicted DNA-binding transcriptional regulator YafY
MTPAQPSRRRLPRTEILVLVKQQLERAGERGLTKQELVAAIGASSPQTIQRALDELRETHDGRIRCVGKIHRWRLEAPLAMPLDAPDRDDLLAVLIAQAILEPLLDAALRERIAKLVEELDERVRKRETPSELPARKAMTSTLTLGTRSDPEILRRLHAACRRKVVRIRYASPWRPAVEAAAWQEIEPWALRVHDGAVYLRAWARGPAEARTFRLAHIEAVEDIKGSRRSPPADVWGEESPAFGIDRDRPGVAVIRLRGPVRASIVIPRRRCTLSMHPEQERGRRRAPPERSARCWSDGG